MQGTPAASAAGSSPNDRQIWMGESTVLNVHTFWRKKIKRLDNPSNWSYKDKESGQVYPIYCLIENW